MGIHVDSVLANAEDFGFAVSPIDLVIGAWRPTSLNRFYIGMVDDVQLYDTALSEEEIQVIMSGLGSAELASAPVPASGVTDMIRDGIVLQWMPGEFVRSHDVYFGIDFDDVNDATTADVTYKGRQEQTTYDPGTLKLGETYFWRIDEVNSPPDSTVYQGEIWNFTVEPASYALPIGAVSCDGVQTELYYNGLQVGTVNVADANFAQIAGGINRGMNNWFGVTIDDVRVYDCALSNAEAAGLAGMTDTIPSSTRRSSTAIKSTFGRSAFVARRAFTFSK